MTLSVILYTVAQQTCSLTELHGAPYTPQVVRQQHECLLLFVVLLLDTHGHQTGSCRLCS